MNRDLPELGFEFEKLEKFNLETALKVLYKEDVRKKIAKFTAQKTNTCVGASFISKRDSKSFRV